MRAELNNKGLKMLFAEKTTPDQLLGKAEELIYQLNETKYHLDYFKDSIKEALYHLSKYKYHYDLLKEVTNDLR